MLEAHEQRREVMTLLAHVQDGSALERLPDRCASLRRSEQCWRDRQRLQDLLGPTAWAVGSAHVACMIELKSVSATEGARKERSRQ